MRTICKYVCIQFLPQLQFHKVHIPNPTLPISPSFSPGPPHRPGPLCPLAECRVLGGTGDSSAAAGTGGARQVHSTGE